MGEGRGMTEWGVCVVTRNGSRKAESEEGEMGFRVCLFQHNMQKVCMNKLRVREELGNVERAGTSMAEAKGTKWLKLGVLGCEGVWEFVGAQRSKAGRRG